MNRSESPEHAPGETSSRTVSRRRPYLLLALLAGLIALLGLLVVFAPENRTALFGALLIIGAGVLWGRLAPASTSSAGDGDQPAPRSVVHRVMFRLRRFGLGDRDFIGLAALLAAGLWIGVTAQAPTNIAVDCMLLGAIIVVARGASPGVVRVVLAVAALAAGTALGAAVHLLF